VKDRRRTGYKAIDLATSLPDVWIVTRAITLRSPAELAEAGFIPADTPELRAVAARYAVAVTPALGDLITATGRDGPVGRQFLPSTEEFVVGPGERSDPIGDERHSPVKGIVHRYPDRALLLPTHACAVYCRFCFRRESVGPGGGSLTPAELAAAVDYIRKAPAIWEVILTGGDPLVLSPRRLAEITLALDAISHVAVIRIHTRLPIAAPERIDDALIAAMRPTRKAIYVAVHCNHAAELTPSAVAACRRLAEAGFGLVSQSVLLRDVNDSVPALEALFRALLAAGVKPYYLHHLDLAPGTGHFRVPLEKGQALVTALRGRLSGLAQPTYMLDVPGGAGKVPVGPSFITRDPGGRVTLRDPWGNPHAYPPE
jgi:lysine 2,3-aminomutase